MGVLVAQTSRRDFFKIAAVGGVAATVFGFDLKPAYAQLKELKIARAKETRSTCPYCAVGCGVLIYTIGDGAKNVTPQVVHVEGDPDHPTNRGTLCPKGSSLEQDMLNPRRLIKPQVRRPGARTGRTFPGIPRSTKLRNGPRRPAMLLSWTRTRMATP